MATTSKTGPLWILPEETLLSKNDKNQPLSYVIHGRAQCRWGVLCRGVLTIHDKEGGKTLLVITKAAMLSVKKLQAQDMLAISLSIAIPNLPTAKPILFAFNNKEEQGEWFTAFHGCIREGENREIPLSDLVAVPQGPAQSFDGVEVRKALLEVLSLHKFQQLNDIWEGKNNLFRILYPFRDYLISLARSVSNCTLVVNLGNMFKEPKKKFVIQDCSMSCGKIVEMICQKMLKNPDDGSKSKNFSLFTTGGFALSWKEPIAAYGFGVLFPTWELNIKSTLLEPEAVIKEALNIKQIKYPDPSSPQVGAPPTITFFFPPLARADGLIKKTLPIAKDRQDIPLFQIRDFVAAKLNIQNPSQYVLATKETTGNGFCLDMSVSPYSYGFGWRFTSWDLEFIPATLVQPSSTDTSDPTHLFDTLPIPELRWVTIPKSCATDNELKSALRFMGKKLKELGTDQEMWRCDRIVQGNMLLSAQQEAQEAKDQLASKTFELEEIKKLLEQTRSENQALNEKVTQLVLQQGEFDGKQKEASANAFRANMEKEAAQKNEAEALNSLAEARAREKELEEEKVQAVKKLTSELKETKEQLSIATSKMESLSKSLDESADKITMIVKEQSDLLAKLEKSEKKESEEEVVESLLAQMRLKLEESEKESQSNKRLYEVMQQRAQMAETRFAEVMRSHNKLERDVEYLKTQSKVSADAIESAARDVRNAKQEKFFACEQAKTELENVKVQLKAAVLLQKETAEQAETCKRLLEDRSRETSCAVENEEKTKNRLSEISKELISTKEMLLKAQNSAGLAIPPRVFTLIEETREKAEAAAAASAPPRSTTPPVASASSSLTSPTSTASNPASVTSPIITASDSPAIPTELSSSNFLSAIKEQMDLLLRSGVDPALTSFATALLPSLQARFDVLSSDSSSPAEQL
eukprot:TRINITY_DN8752_c0_g1_i1.p1 TRINITY_DN8752_c0_g1~~TRINITY_DN8752_c0_g1_i1.p1  ORF type:complete len:924 (-),score=309.27 TRINITY_DN8752_c0_g1_i1:165-2936(-)